MPQHLLQPTILPQVREIFQTLPTQRIQHHKAFYHGRFIVPTVPLLEVQQPLDTGRQPQGTESLHYQGHATPGRQCFGQRLRINFK